MLLLVAITIVLMYFMMILDDSKLYNINPYAAKPAITRGSLITNSNDLIRKCTIFEFDIFYKHLLQRISQL